MGFVGVQNGALVAGDVALDLRGVNLWQAMWLGAFEPARLRRELDGLCALGLDTVRIFGASEGPDDAPLRIVPSLRPAPERWNEALLAGLDVALAEIGARGMRAIVCLGNFWHWSGGFAQLRAWSEGSPIPYPDVGDATWDDFVRYAAGFYALPAARALYAEQLDRIVSRHNAVTGHAYRDDPAIVAWEIANEPRGVGSPGAMRAFIAEAAAAIRARGANHLVASGSEGSTADPEGAGLDFGRDHEGGTIDIATLHLWPENWGIWDPARNDDGDFEAMLAWAEGEVRRHAVLAAAMHKPLVLEELGLARDGRSFDPSASTDRRDRFFRRILEIADTLRSEGTPLAGVLFWAWSGEARPARPGVPWRWGDAPLGDPPHEPEGWYGIYNRDRSTLDVIGRRR